MSLRRCLALSLFLSVIAAGTAQATTALALSNRAMTDLAALILTGRCVEVRSAWEGRTLVTLATVEVTDVLKGDAPARVTVTLPGGIDANRKFPIAMTYAGAPQMMVGEDVFLFLGDGSGIGSGLTVVGFSQGTMMSLHVGLRRAAPVAAIVGYSGMFVLPNDGPPETIRTDVRSRPPVLLVHGDRDDLIPAQALFHACGALSEIEIPVEWHLSQGIGHGIDGEGLRHGGEFLARRFRV